MTQSEDARLRTLRELRGAANEIVGMLEKSLFELREAGIDADAIAECEFALAAVKEDMEALGLQQT